MTLQQLPECSNLALERPIDQQRRAALGWDLAAISSRQPDLGSSLVWLHTRSLDLRSYRNQDKSIGPRVAKDCTASRTTRRSPSPTPASPTGASPLAEIAPGWRVPPGGETVAQLVESTEGPQPGRAGGVELGFFHLLEAALRPMLIGFPRFATG